MAGTRATQLAKAPGERRPAAAAAVHRPAAAPAPARSLQGRLGNHATQALVARSIAAPEREAPGVPVGVTAPSAVQLSRAARLPLKVSKPTDPAEIEAEETARKVMRMREPPAGSPPAATGTTRGVVQRAPVAEAPPPGREVPSPVAGSAGAPLPAPLRAQMESRFGAPFGHVRVHAGEAAARQSAALNANAFTVGQHVFFGRNRFQPQSAGGQELIAHELTHTIQQGASVQRDVVHRSGPVQVSGHAAPHVQRDFLGIPNPREYFADKAANIMGYTMLTVVIGYDPIRGSRVARSPGNILRGAIQLIPGGKFITDALDSHGLVDRAGHWVATQFETLKDIGSQLLQDIERFIDDFSIWDLRSPGDLWDRAKAIVMRPVDRIVQFAIDLKNGIVTLIKEAILKPIAAFARTTRGYPLLCAVMGRDPITGEPVPQGPEALLGGFMTFIGEDELWATMQKAKAVPRAFAWFNNALNALRGFISEIPGLFITALKSLDIQDIILIHQAFKKLAHVFGNFAMRFVTWGAGAVWTLLEIIFDVVSPGALRYIKKTGAALKRILRNPLPFVRNLVRAAKLGFSNFAGNFLTHLKAGLIDWLTGSLPGIYIPKAFSLPEIAKFVFSVLGLTWANIRQKLVKATSETFVKALETGFDIVVTLVRQGPAAAWDKIKEQLANLKDMVIGGITDFVVDMVVKKAIPKLIAMFIPGAGFISAILSIYDTVMVFVNKIKQIVQVVTGFIDSIVAIAAGQVGAAAARVEKALAGVLSLAINFLAGFAGLGKVADRIMGVIGKIRAPIDKALDWLVGWIVKAAKGLVAKGKAGLKALLAWWKTKVSFKAGGEAHSLYFQGEGAAARLVVASAPRPVEAFLDEKAADAKGDKEKQDAIKAVRALIREVDKLKPKPGAKPDDETLQKKIETLMNKMGDHLVTLLSDHEWGTQGNPSPFDYPKRRAEAYPTFYLATGALAQLEQDEMSKRFAKQAAAKGDRIYQYRPTAMTDLPDKSAKLGLGPASQIQVGKKVLFEDKEARGSGVAQFKALVARFGFVASKSGWDIDHVVELQIGGQDQRDNMWPLPKGENRSSGSIIKAATVEIPKTKERKPVKTALEEKKKGKKGQKPQSGLWLLIRGTRQL